MRRVSAAFLLLASVSMSAQNGAVSASKVMPPPENGQFRTSKIAGVTANVHNISLCQTYDHYLHDIPVSTDTDSYLRKILVEQKTVSGQSIQQKIAPDKK